MHTKKLYQSTVHRKEVRPRGSQGAGKTKRARKAGESPVAARLRRRAIATAATTTTATKKGVAGGGARRRERHPASTRSGERRALTWLRAGPGRPARRPVSRCRPAAAARARGRRTRAPPPAATSRSPRPAPRHMRPALRPKRPPRPHGLRQRRRGAGRCVHQHGGRLRLECVQRHLVQRLLAEGARQGRLRAPERGWRAAHHVHGRRQHRDGGRHPIGEGTSRSNPAWQPLTEAPGSSAPPPWGRRKEGPREGAGHGPAKVTHRAGRALKGRRALEGLPGRPLEALRGRGARPRQGNT